MRRLMSLALWRRVRRALGLHGRVRSFEEEVARHGAIAQGSTQTISVEVARIVGSVGRARSMRSDFFYRRVPAVTQRYRRIGEAIRRGDTLPPVELYRVYRRDPHSSEEIAEYYVVDGHHRVAMARQLGQIYLDARVVDFRFPERALEAGWLQRDAGHP